MGFKLDFGGPGFFSILYDRIKNGKEGAFERFSERSEVALESADLNSGITYSHCDGSPPTPDTKQMSLAPDHGVRTRRMAEDCRSCKGMSFTKTS